MSGPVFLAFSIWMLLTAEFSWVNGGMGLIGALAVSLFQPYRFSFGQFMKLVFLIVLNLPRAIAETFLMVLLPHRQEEVRSHQLKHPDDPWASFVEIFIITFTPFTLVTRADRKGRTQLHIISRKGNV